MFTKSSAGRFPSQYHHIVPVVLEGTGRIGAGDELMTLAPHSTLVVESGTARQIFNDTPTDALWLVVGAPPKPRTRSR